MYFCAQLIVDFSDCTHQLTRIDAPITPIDATLIVAPAVGCGHPNDDAAEALRCVAMQQRSSVEPHASTTTAIVLPTALPFDGASNAAKAAHRGAQRPARNVVVVVVGDGARCAQRGQRTSMSTHRFRSSMQTGGVVELHDRAGQQQ